MSIGQCFISYSTADSLDFARRLADELEGGEDKFIDVWIDKRNIDPARDWDDQIVDGIKSCKCMLFVMSKDSTSPGSLCKNEWTWALKYKKIIIPIRFHKDVEQPFGLGNRQWIDFTESFEHGLAKLRKFLREMDSPKGALQSYRDRLADADRALRRANGGEVKRIQTEIEELKKQIEIQQKIAENPKAAEEQTHMNIQAGLELERQPVSFTLTKTATKFVNPSPGIAPNYFQDRQLETKEIIRFLQDESQRLMTIVGRGGVGKTAMICRLLKSLERGELPDGLGVMKIEGIVYLTESGSHRINLANIYYDLCKLLPHNIAQELDAIYKNPSTSTENKMRALLEKFSGDRVVLLLDNFEPLVDTETFAIRDTELDDALRSFLNGTHTAVNVVITTRVAPRSLNLIQAGRQRVLTLDEGLESPYAENIMREMDNDGSIGLKAASHDLLRRARERTRGYPRALEALFAILASDRYTTLEEVLAMPMPENVVEALVGEAFNRLDTNSQKVMQALAVYNRPVTSAAVDYLLAPHLPAMDSAAILPRLASMHFTRKERGKFYLHPVDREFVFALIPDTCSDGSQSRQEKDAQSTESLRLDSYNQCDLTARAADYFRQARKPRKEWKKLDDLMVQLAEFDLRCAIQDYDGAANVLVDFDEECLFLWGHYRLMIEMHERIRGKIVDRSLSMNSMGSLGLGYHAISKFHKAIECYQHAREIAIRLNDRSNEGAFLAKTGLTHGALGDAHKAKEYFEQALKIAHELSDKKNGGKWYGNLGSSYEALGDFHKAIECREKALGYFREIKYRRGEGYQLGKIGNIYLGWGNVSLAMQYFEDALKIALEVGNQEEEANQLGKIGSALAVLENNPEALKYYQRALSVARKIGNRNEEEIQLGNIGVTYAALGTERDALDSFEQALAIAREIGDRRGEGAQLGNLGDAHVNLGNADKAFQYYEQALEISQEIGERRSEAARLGSLGHLYFYYLGEIDNGIEFYERALQIRRDIGDRKGESDQLANSGYAILEKRDIHGAVNHFQSAILIADEIKRAQTQSIARCGLAETYLFQNDLARARGIIEAALRYDVPLLNHNTAAILGIISLRQGDTKSAYAAFQRAIELSDEILTKTPNYFPAQDSKGLALYGSALCSKEEAQKLKYAAKAADIFSVSRKIAPYKGVVKRLLRLFDDLSKCDVTWLAEDIRSAATGK